MANLGKPMRNDGGRRVVVVGGGYAGSAVAQGLDDVADVVLVEPKDMFVHNIATLRALVDPDWLELSLFPYDRLLQLGRVVCDRATFVDSDGVTLASGDRLDADIIVLSTGSSYPFPAKYEVSAGAEAKGLVQRAHLELAASEHVLLLGAGAVGIELACEIRYRWPEKAVSIVDPVADVLNGRFRPELREELRRQLVEFGIDLVLGSPLRQLPTAPAGVRTPIEVATAGGQSISADIWFQCFGTAPSSDYLGGSLADARGPDGFIEVTPLLQVKGHDTVFALGDVAAANAVKLAAIAMEQSGVVVANVRALLTGGETTPYQPAPEGIAVSLGPFGGAAQLPGQDRLASAEFVREMKGRNLGVDRFATKFGYQVQPR